ncbi:T9SS type A sorting domain-containing protein [Rufibacter hautae]|uniref:T9SS type A sorting domain-containing protein n=1 Tax=Rufibacter hautae TaxID=2595005 RepID=A0A5B6TDD0_9BACT|nr:T9SS type A sorting domain-containing protein [Rufibacter hautae]KAA3437113.1 hypothetical protein FOA19_22370 [Rufibacter hautae]
MKNLFFSVPLVSAAAEDGGAKSSISPLRFWRVAFLFAVLLLMAGTSFAQVQLPSASRCTSKDLELVRARLLVDECQSCEPGELITAPLELSIYNKTSSLRRAFSFWGNLVIKNSSGQVTYNAEVTGCDGPIAKNDTSSLPFDVVLVREIVNSPASNSGLTGTEITYECGSTIELTNLFLAWTDASPNSTCATVNSALIAPKCGTLPAIAVATGLTASSVATNVTCFGDADGAVNATVAGGTPPYTFSWEATGGGMIPAGQGDNEDLTGLVPGTYTLTVTDAAGCESTTSETITQPDEVIRPAVTVVEPSLCGPSTGTVTVTAPVGSQYEYSKNGGATWQPSPIFPGLAAGAGFSITVRRVGTTCVSEATDCDNYDEAVTAAPAIRSAAAPSTSNLALTKKAVAREAVARDTKLAAYPIPFSDRATVQFKSTRGEDYAINLYDLKGNLVRQLKAGRAKANEVIRVEVDGRGMAEGMYLARKVSKAGVSSVKLLKRE